MRDYATVPVCFLLNVLCFAFYGIIQDKLPKTMTKWNIQRIRCAHNSETPERGPDVLFFTPNVAKMFCKDLLIFGCSDEFAELAIVVMKKSGLQRPTDRKRAEELYFR